MTVQNALLLLLVTVLLIVTDGQPPADDPDPNPKQEDGDDDNRRLQAAIESLLDATPRFISNGECLVGRHAWMARSNPDRPQGRFLLNGWIIQGQSALDLISHRQDKTTLIVDGEVVRGPTASYYQLIMAIESLRQPPPPPEEKLPPKGHVLGSDDAVPSAPVLAGYRLGRRLRPILQPVLRTGLKSTEALADGAVRRLVLQKLGRDIQSLLAAGTELDVPSLIADPERTVSRWVYELGDELAATGKTGAVVKRSNRPVGQAPNRHGIAVQ